jgi:methylated-DNA-[protein]-cysteine S-methyltransferase
MSCPCDTFSTAAGPFSLAVDAEGAVVGAVFGEAEALRARLPGELLWADPGRCAAARREVQSYLAGERRDFTVRVEAHGTPFQERVWAALRAIPRGETVSYGELAARVGRPGAARAVGAANGRNPVCLLVPCHRVIAADGALHGYAFGTEKKRWLLELEGVTAVRGNGAGGGPPW